MGNDMIRGVSGGEKKRTSIAEAFTAAAAIQAWDNTTRGLDSVTALEVISTLKQAAVARGSTLLVTVYQASQAIYNQFDKVSLLYQGRQIYFGPTVHAIPFFEELGFIKPERQSAADFLTSLTNPYERVAVVRPGFEVKVPRSAQEFAEVWESSSTRRALEGELEAYNAQYPPQQEAVSRYHVSKAM